MEKREQDILKKIDEKSKDVQVPEKLMPKQIEKLLKEQEKKKTSGSRKLYHIGSLLAACLVLAVGVGIAGNMGREHVTDDAAKNVPAESETEIAKDMEEDTEKDTAAEENADDYKKVYSYIKAKLDEQAEKESIFFDTLESGSAKSVASEEAKREIADIAESTDMAAEDMGSANTSGGEYSETNVRQEGVDEGDILKTDGRYLYVLKENGRQISIVDTKDSLKQIGEVKVKKERQIQEFYVIPEKNRLVYISSVREEKRPLHKATEEKEDVYEEDDAYIYLGDESMEASEKVEAVTCDIENPKEPKELGSVTQSGSYSSSRMAEGYLYLFSSYVVGSDIDKSRPRTFIPMVNDSLIREKDISLPPFKCGSMYEVVTAVALDEPSQTADSKAIFTDGGSLYVSNENIYYYETKWNNNGDAEKTVIRKIGYKDGKLSSAAQGSIKGYINDSFSIDEYKGNLRIVATVGETNSVYVLDGKLKTIGSIKKLAKDERVYSARLLGDTGYFVTFRETDPLFSVDFSNPKKPKILGKLKIPGFSDYLHFYGKDKLLGIGMNVEEDAQVTDGVKLSMFDISDNTDVKEENKLILKNVYSTDVSYDYKAALINVGKNIIGFAGSTEGGERYYLFGYDEKEGFTCRMSEEINGRSMRAARGVYIDDTLYVVCGNVIEAYSLKDYKKIEDLIL